MYYKLRQNQGPRIPGIVAIVAVIAMFGGILSYATKHQSSEKPVASNVSIERAEVANIRDNTVTIYWQTEKPTQGYIMYGATPENIMQKVVDKRDISSQPVARRNHVVTLSNLTSNTNYYYNLYINDQPVGQTVEIPFQFKTARYLKNPSNLDPIIGKIIEDGGSVSAEAIVLIYIGSAHPLIAQAKEDGSFAISPCCIFDRATYEPAYPQHDEAVVIEVIDERGAHKKISTTLGDIDSATSVIALNSEEQPEKIASKGVILGESESSVLQMAEDVQSTDVIDIIFPRKNALIPGTKPLLKGVGIPEKPVRIVLEPSGRIFETTIASNRVWQFQPTFDLSPGQHTLEVTTQNEEGETITLDRVFFIEKSGESVLGDATPSASLTPVASPTAELITETPSPTEILPTAVPSLPKSGNNILPFGIVSLLLVIIGAGMIFLM